MNETTSELALNNKLVINEHHRDIPGCSRGGFKTCSTEKTTNTYKNTIAYSGFILSQVIEQLKKLANSINKSMIYISAHCESIGESGAYLHALYFAFSPKERRHIPILVWKSPKSQQNNVQAYLNFVISQLQNSKFK